MIPVELSWGWSDFARRLLAVAGLGLLSAFAFARPALAVVAAAPLGWFVLAVPRREPRAATVRFEHPARCFEQEDVTMQVTLELDGAAELIELALVVGRGFRVSGKRPASSASSVRRAEVATEIIAPRWGKHSVGQLRIEVWQRLRLRRASAIVHAPEEISVFPRPAPMQRLPVGSARFDRVGDHPATTAGSGVEFHGIRRFAPGDRPRRINWPVSTRRGELYVNTSRAERAVDVIVAVDVLVDAGAAGRSSRDLALRGATGVVQTVLRSHDRVGLVAVGGRLSWLRPGPGARQFYRIAEAILDVIDWQSYLDPDVDSIPYPALPSGAHLIFFSPLLDQRGIAAAMTLRRRGHPVTVIDVCTSEPRTHGTLGDLALRLWRLERAATRGRLAALGVSVAPWDGTHPMDALIAPLLRVSERVPR